jgi:crotonobetainyl-CoA:carnitine CoA-transferase CaiB-like acyl-CoA transferase
MPGPLQGIRVVEVGFWVAGPATAGILADWGAEVVKIEPPPAGDPFRGIFLSAVGIDVPFNPPFELDNRGKRSVAIDLKRDEGRELARRLVDRADVFVTNLRPGALARMGLDYETLAARNPGLVYCSVTGYGVVGPDRDRPAYDIGAFWSRGGAAMLTPPGHEPPVQRGGMGDHTTAIAAAGAVSAALVARGRTGRGQHVVASLLRTGIYVVGWDVATRLRFGYVAPPGTRRESPNPIANSYRAGDGRWLWLIGLEADRHWPDVCRAIARPDLIEDPRTASIVARRENAAAVVAILEEELAKRSLAEWSAIFDREGVWWAPVQDCDDIAADPQVRAAGGVVPFDAERGLAEQVATPVDFLGTPLTPGRTAPETGQHTEEVLLELGHDWEAIAALKERGVIP